MFSKTNGNGSVWKTLFVLLATFAGGVAIASTGHDKLSERIGANDVALAKVAILLEGLAEDMKTCQPCCAGEPTEGD